MAQAFDQIAGAYDQWYDTPEGRAIFNAELSCLRFLWAKCEGRWLEVGVGSGRFAATLGVAEGIDPSPNMLDIAAGRGIRTHEGQAEDLPFPDGVCDGVLLVLTLCFVADPQRALRECRRILRPEGRLLLGVIPADGPWGKEYEKKKAKGHPVYAQARFRTSSENVALIKSAGFALQNAASTLFWGPGGPPDSEPRVKAGVVSGAGFLGLLCKKARPQPSRGSLAEDVG